MFGTQMSLVPKRLRDRNVPVPKSLRGGNVPGNQNVLVRKCIWDRNVYPEMSHAEKSLGPKSETAVNSDEKF